jgi:uncharacterized protein
MIESPCTNVCTLDARSGLCLGCSRTIEEISRWPSMSDAERARVISELADRPAARGNAKSARATG